MGQNEGEKEEKWERKQRRGRDEEGGGREDGNGEKAATQSRETGLFLAITNYYTIQNRLILPTKIRDIGYNV